jgi:hypothetical protein
MEAAGQVPLKYCYVFINTNGVTYHIVRSISVIIIIIIIIIGYQYGLSEGPPMSCYKSEPQSTIESSLYHDRTTHNNRPDIVLLHKTIKEEYLI